MKDHPAPPLKAAVPPGSDRSMLAVLTDALDRRIQEKAKEGPPRMPVSIRDLTLVPRG